MRAGLEGPFYGIKALLLRPIDGFIHSGSDLLPAAIFTVVVTAWTLSWLDRATNQKIRSDADVGHRQMVQRDASWKVLASGLLMWPISYVLWIPNDYFPPIVGIGRLTGEHAGAAVAAGLTGAGLAGWLLSIPQGPKKFCALAFSCYCGALTSFGVHIQRSEYVAYWDETKNFWNNLLPRIQDVAEGDVILVEQSADSRVLPVTQGFSIWSEEFNFPVILPYFVNFPSGWKTIPRVYGIWPQIPFQNEGEAMRLNTPTWNRSIWPTIRSGNFIYFRVSDGRLDRITQGVEIGGRIFQPKLANQGKLSPLKLSDLYLNLTSEPNSKDWFTLRNAKSYP